MSPIVNCDWIAPGEAESDFVPQRWIGSIIVKYRKDQEICHTDAFLGSDQVDQTCFVI